MGLKTLLTLIFCKKVEKFACLNTFLNLQAFFCGISRTRRIERAISLWITSVCIFGVLGCVIGFMNTTSTTGIEILFSECVAYVLFLRYHWIMKNHKDSVVRFITLLRRPDADHYSEEMTKKMADFCVTISPSVFVFNIFFLFCLCVPTMVPFFVEIGFHNSLAYILPFWYLCDEHGENHFPVTFLCFHVDNYSKFLLINITGYVSVVIGVFVFESVSFFYLFTQIYLRFCCHHIIQRIRNLTDISEEYYKTIDVLADLKKNHYDGSDLRHVYDKIIRHEFVNIIQYHQFIFRISQTIIPIYRSIISSTLAGIYTVGVLCIFDFMSMSQKEAGQFIYQAKMGAVLVFILIVFLLFCYGADYMTQMNEEIAKVAYETPWHQNSLEYRKMLSMFLHQTQKPIRVTAFGMYRISLNYYMLMIKNIYSILNVVIMKLGTK